jgi:polar amino acid transport system substrate-binding protein
MVRFVNAVLENIRTSGVWQDSYHRWVEARLGPASPLPAQYQ